MIANRGGPEAHNDWGGGGGSGDIAPRKVLKFKCSEIDSG